VQVLLKLKNFSHNIQLTTRHVNFQHTACHITSCPIISYHVTSYRVISHHIVSHYVTSHHVTSHYVISHRIMSYHVISLHITSHHIMSRHVSSLNSINIFCCTLFPHWISLLMRPNTTFQLPSPPCTPQISPLSSRCMDDGTHNAITHLLSLPSSTSS
jgi:hypothetical protein